MLRAMGDPGSKNFVPCLLYRTTLHNLNDRRKNSANVFIKCGDVKFISVAISVEHSFCFRFSAKAHRSFFS